MNVVEGKLKDNLGVKCATSTISSSSLNYIAETPLTILHADPLSSSSTHHAHPTPALWVYTSNMKLVR